MDLYAIIKRLSTLMFQASKQTAWAPYNALKAMLECAQLFFLLCFVLGKLKYDDPDVLKYSSVVTLLAYTITRTLFTPFYDHLNQLDANHAELLGNLGEALQQITKANETVSPEKATLSEALRLNNAGALSPDQLLPFAEPEGIANNSIFASMEQKSANLNRNQHLRYPVESVAIMLQTFFAFVGGTAIPAVPELLILCVYIPMFSKGFDATKMAAWAKTLVFSSSALLGFQGAITSLIADIKRITADKKTIEALPQKCADIRLTYSKIAEKISDVNSLINETKQKQSQSEASHEEIEPRVRTLEFFDTELFAPKQGRNEETTHLLEGVSIQNNQNGTWS